MSQEAVQRFIEHHGIKGMKWGVRRDRRQLRRESGEHKKVAELRARPKKTLTNRQLKTVNTRLELESKFTKMNPSTLKKGEMAAAGILATGVLASNLFNLSKSPAGKALMGAGKKFVSRKAVSGGTKVVNGQLKLF